MPDSPITRTLFRPDPGRPGRLIATEPYSRHLSGRVTPLLSPRPEDHDIEDIAVGLSRIQRFTGQMERFYSVAEHSCRVAFHLDEIGQPPAVQLAGLLHDAHEYLTGDVSTPVKAALSLMDGGRRSTLAVLQQRHQRAIHQMAGLPAELPSDWLAIIDIADRRLLATEARDLCPHMDPDVDLPPGIEPLPAPVAPVPAWSACDAFLVEYHRLRALAALAKKKEETE